MESSPRNIERPAMLLTQKEAAAACRRCEKTLYLAVRRGELRQVKLGRSVRYRPVDLSDWIERLQQRQEGGCHE